MVLCGTAILAICLQSRIMMLSIDDELVWKRRHSVPSPKNKTVRAVEKLLPMSIDEDTFIPTHDMMQLGAHDSLHYLRIFQLSTTSVWPINIFHNAVRLRIALLPPVHRSCTRTPPLTTCTFSLEKKNRLCGQSTRGRALLCKAHDPRSVTEF